MPSVNAVFMGNLLYPEGLADTKRFQHFVDGAAAGEGSSASVLLLRQSHPGRDDSRLSGVWRGVEYRTIGEDIRPGFALPLAAVRYLACGCRYLWRSRRRDARNVLFVYGEPNLENLLFIVFARLLGYRVVVDIVEDRYFIPGKAPLLSRLKARSVRWTTDHMGWFADGIVVISSYLQGKLSAIVGPGLPVQLIPISVDLDRVAASGSGFHDPVRMLYAGNFGDKDDMDSLLEAFEAVAARCPGVELVMTGKGVAERMAQVRERIGRSPFAGRIRYLGYLPDDDYFRLIGDCDILCVVRTASEFADRGFPFKLGEYLASGRPVVASRVSDVGAYLADRVSAMLVEPGSAAQIGAAIEYLLADEARALEIGAAGRRVAAEHFSARDHGRRLLELVERMESA